MGPRGAVLILTWILLGCACGDNLVPGRDDAGGDLVDGGVNADANGGGEDASSMDGATTDDAATIDGDSTGDASTTDDASTMDGGATGDASTVDGGATGDASAMDGGTTGDASTMDGSGETALVRINEVVVTPRRDWSDSAGTPFDSTPGAGAITSTDQFVELINVGPTPVDLRGWTLELIDQEPSTTVLAGHNALYFTAGSSVSALAPGGLAVIGDPVGFAATDVYVVLRDASGRIVDDVEIGGLTLDRDFEGDGIGDGAPGPNLNGYARGAFDEAIARPFGAVDTDNDAADFDKMRATPLALNVMPPPPVETIPPQVLSRSSGTAYRITDAIWIQLDEPVEASTVDGNLTLTVGGLPIALGFSTFDDNDRIILVNPIGVLPFDADVMVRLNGGATGVRDLAGNPLASDLIFTVHTEAAPPNPALVRINELCADPLQDWNDSSGGDGLPFSPTPGTGMVSPADEWIELHNLRPGVSDLSGYSLVLYRGPSLYAEPRARTALLSAFVRVFGAGANISDVRMGDRVVVGDPAGVMPPDFWIELRDASGVLVDVVEVGGNSAITDRGGNGINNGAPDPGADATAVDLDSEVVARVPETDTGVDVNDFAHAAATLGAMN